MLFCTNMPHSPSPCCDGAIAIANEIIALLDATAQALIATSASVLAKAGLIGLLAEALVAVTDGVDKKDCHNPGKFRKARRYVLLYKAEIGGAFCLTDLLDSTDSLIADLDTLIQLCPAGHSEDDDDD